MSERMIGLMVLITGLAVLGLSVTAFPGMAILRGSDYWFWAAGLAAFFGLLEIGSGAFLSRERLTSTGGMS